MPINIISTGKNKLKQITKQLVIKNNGKSITKHVVLKDKSKGIYFDSHNIPYIIN